MKTGSHTPWGPAQTVKELAPGITSVTTSGHGGIHLDKAHQDLVPVLTKETNWLGSTEWFEEDCDWCIPFVLFESEILEHGDDWSRETIKNNWHTTSAQRNHPNLKVTA